MWPATALDDSEWEGPRARGWTVMGRLQQRQRELASAAVRARRAQAEARQSTSSALMTAAYSRELAEREMRARWRGGPQVVAFLFAPPDTDAIRSLDARGDYLNVRTGDDWDLFFPGYHRSGDHGLEAEVGSRRVGREFARDWYFNARDFDIFRREVEGASGGLWRYSGGADLVVAVGYMPDAGPITIDWESTMSGSLTEREGARSLTVAETVERLSQDLEDGAEDPHFGLAEVFNRMPEGTDSKALRDFTMGVLTAIAAQFGKDRLGM
jgi:hypothetical protein